MRADCLFAITAAGALALVAACSATDQPVVQETVQDTVPDTAHVAAQGATPGIAGIMAAIEKAGFTCEVQERHPDRFVPVADCRSTQDKYRQLIASAWKDPAARHAMYQGRRPGGGGQRGLNAKVTWSASGGLSLLAGGDTEKDVAALEQFADTLGFEPHAVPCQ